MNLEHRPYLGRFLPLVGALVLLVLAGCGYPHLIGIDDPDAATSVRKSASSHVVFVTTTRRPSADPAVLYSSGRSPTLGLASLTVTVPARHVAGRVERARRLPPDRARHFTAIDPHVYDRDADFIAAIDRELMKRPPEDRKVLLFVHGYNNTPSSSVLRVAQFVEDSGFNGVPVLFSWASAGRPSRYVYDMNSVLAARPLVETASALLVQTKATGFDIFAHSMGTLLVMEVMLQSDLRGNLGSSGRLENVVLAAPDINIVVFRSQLGQIQNNPGNIYLFVSRDDRALRMSLLLAGGVDRVGAAQAREFEGLGVTVIDVSRVGDSTGGPHEKFAGSPEVVRLIGQSLARNHYDESQDGPRILTLDGGTAILDGLVR